jgi:hypothetical protein
MIFMDEPKRLERSAAFATGTVGGSVQRRLRKMSTHPEDPRVFSQAKIWVPLGSILSLLMTLLVPIFVGEYLDGTSDDIFSIILPGLFTLFCYLLLLMGLFRRFGVDRDKVWTRFGKLFNRQIRFENVDRVDMGVGRFKVYAGGTKINIDYNRFDYSLVYIRLLEELQYRHIKVKNIEVDNPEWEATAQAFRNVFATHAYQNHQAFYDAHPEELDRLQALVQSPKSYVD